MSLVLVLKVTTIKFGLFFIFFTSFNWLQKKANKLSVQVTNFSR